MKREVAHLVLEAVSKQRDELVALLKNMVLIESPSTHPESQVAILALLKEELSVLDYEVSLVPGNKTGGHLLGEWRSVTTTKGRQLLLGHCDTVWPTGTLQHMPFMVEKNIARGPGVFDMKAGLAIMIIALRTLKALELSPALAPVVFINSDEELGSPESELHIREQARSVDRAFVFEPGLGLSGKIKTTRKGVGRFKVSVSGRAAHAGLDPDKGISAVLELSHVIQKLYALSAPDEGISINVAPIEGGVRSNVVASSSCATIDVRAPTMESAKRIEREIFNIKPTLPGANIVVEGAFDRAPMEPTRANLYLWKTAQNLANLIGLDLESGHAGGASDGNITSQYTATLDGLGAVGDGAHAKSEHIDLNKTIERCALVALLLLSEP